MVLNFPATLLAFGQRLRERPESVLLLVGLVWSVWLATQLMGPTASTSSESLIHGLAPSQAAGVKRVGVLTDGVGPRRGDAWNTDLTSTFRGRATIEFDLGASKDIRAGYLVGDGNDEYVLTVSEDGSTYEPLWRAGPASGSGMQERSSSELTGRGRYVRIAARGGDNLYALGEVQLFDKVPDEIPSRVTLRGGLPDGERVRGHFLHFLLAMGLMLFASCRKSSWKWKLAAAVPPVTAGAVLVASIINEWPVDHTVVSMARALSAGIAVLAVVREVMSPVRWPASRTAVLCSLTLAGVLAVGSFYNLGRLQFHDSEKDRPTFVHTFDMRVYYPVAKYFHELRFDGLYLASVAAYAADVQGTTRATMEKVQFRDLKTHRMVRAGEAWDQVLAMEARFSPERWQAFLKDMRYFRLTMGPDYLGSMVDHGANATPVWLAQAYLLFAMTDADETTLVLGGLLDPALLLLAFAAVARAYGWRASLLCMVVFGANDFVMLGSNWAGATLRHDWLAYLLIAMAALRMKKPVIGGLFLALAAAQRAFPALALVGLAFPMFGWLYWEMKRTGAWPTRASWIENNRETFRVWGSAIVGGLVLFLFASLILSFNAWPEWFRKVTLLDSEPHVNQVSLKAFVGGTDFPQESIVRARWPLFGFLAVAVAVSSGIIAWMRRASLDQAAILGCLLIPVLFNPANYYIHFITILPLLGCSLTSQDKRATPTWSEVSVWLPILFLCIAQYWTTKTDDRTIHFEMASALLFFAFGAMLVASFRASAPALRKGEPTPSA